MTERSGSAAEMASWRMDTFPEDFSRGATVLLASAGGPARYAVDLAALCEFGTDVDTALVVTTSLSADTTLETYERLCQAPERPELRFVDTTARQPSVPTVYGDSTTVHIPSAGDLERLVIALSDLTSSTPPSTGARHLVVRSLTPILETTPTARVNTVLERIRGLRTKAGLCLFGIDYTAHDEGTIRSLVEGVDGVLWVTESAPDALEFEYLPTRGRYHGRLLETPE